MKAMVELGQNDRPGPGKFEGNPSRTISEVLHDWTLDGSIDAELGDVEGFGWYGLIVEISPKDTVICALWGKSFIVHEDNQGFFDYTEYETEKTAREDWEALESDYDDYLGAE